MHARLALLLSSLFIVLGGLNVWLMLGSHVASRRSPKFYIVAHRTIGYVFILLYSVMMYYMVLRLKGIPDEISPRILLHMSLALLLAPLLLLKVFVARHQKTLQGLLRALGVSIFAISFTLVALNVVVLLLRTAAPGRVSPLASTTFLLFVSAVLGMLWLRGPVQASAAESAGAARFNGSNEAVIVPVQAGNRAFSLLLSRVQPQTADTKTLRFLLPQNERWSARPGQFLTFEWMINSKRVVRSYSICSSPTQSAYIEITPKRVPNGQVSTFLNRRAAPGMMVTVRGPYGKFYFDEQQHKRIVLIAGGSGITPMMSMLRYIDDRCLPVEVVLIYCVRTEDDVLFETELMELQTRQTTFRYILVLSQPNRQWKGPSGHLGRELLEANLESFAAATVFLCGPQPFMDNVRNLLASIGIDPANIKQESFNSPPSAQPGLDSNAIFDVEFVRSARTCKVPHGKTLLEVAEMNGLSLPFSCRQGQCGTCVSRLLSGEVQMSAEDGLGGDLKAAGYILPCVSRACSDIKLDV